MNPRYVTCSKCKAGPFESCRATWSGRITDTHKARREYRPGGPGAGGYGEHQTFLEDHFPPEYHLLAQALWEMGERAGMDSGGWA